MYVDAHCHLERETYGDELEAVIERARAAGLSHFVAVGASGVLAGAREVVKLAASRPEVFAAVGIHPHDAAKAGEADARELAGLLVHPRVVALGEIGLDYHYDNSPRDRQRQVFRELLEVGRAQPKPVMLHVREAHEDAWALLDEIGLPAGGGVIHCFTGGPREAAGYLERGLMISIPGVVTFPSAAPLREAVREVPLERLLVETDCPYLAPVPHRGRRNEPAFLTITAAALGGLKGMAGEELGELTRRNALRFFGLPAA